jgi:hypothetical protein
MMVEECVYEGQMLCIERDEPVERVRRKALSRKRRGFAVTLAVTFARVDVLRDRRREDDALAGRPRS